MVLKRMKKKGIFFTLVAILASTILFIAFSPDDYAAQSGKTDVAKDRITKADNFVRTVEQSYIERALKHSTYSA
ncbi:hypothetical protein HQ529_03310, partial [Candidatus Woesearchaeota archaeon]|nr:hypothetical protein [Candidatus Woesearchaeota archaeon]